MTKKEFFVLIETMKKCFSSGCPSDDGLSVWYEMLKDIDYQSAQYAVRELIQTNVFFPRIAEIRKACMKQNYVEMSTDEAWGQVKRAIRMYGMYQEDKAIASMHPDVAEIVKRFSWMTICTTPDGEQAIRARFMDAFKGHQERKLSEFQIQSDVTGYKHRLQEKTQPEVVFEIAGEVIPEPQEFDSDRVSKLISGVAEELGGN